ncbi:MAG: hypothetical protein IPM16_10865 [Chloroflexi bacterium]|nr:hypothetical protein [Chloroflexota bacterium]
MTSPAAVPLSEDDFITVARALFPDADDETLAQLYPMVSDLRELAALVSQRVLSGAPLSETATGE